MKEIEINGTKLEVGKSVDAVGFFCPMPVVKLKLELEKAGINKVVELLTGDPEILEDLPAWRKETGKSGCR